MEWLMKVTQFGIHVCKKVVSWGQKVLNEDVEQEEGERDPYESVDHAEHLPLCGERGLLPIAYGCDHCARKEEGLTKAPVRNFGGREGHPTFTVGDHG